MKTIQLTRGYFALVDDEDFDRLCQWSWHANVGTYQVRAARMSMRQMVYMHHEILRIVGLGLEIDHTDGNPLNNQKYNLNVVTHQQNMLNTKRHKERKGYCWNMRVSMYSCYLDMPGMKRKYLGYTKTEEEAIIRVREARDACLRHN